MVAAIQIPKYVIGIALMMCALFQETMEYVKVRLDCGKNNTGDYWSQRKRKMLLISL